MRMSQKRKQSVQVSTSQAQTLVVWRCGHVFAQQRSVLALLTPSMMTTLFVTASPPPSDIPIATSQLPIVYICTDIYSNPHCWMRGCMDWLVLDKAGWLTDYMRRSHRMQISAVSPSWGPPGSAVLNLSPLGVSRHPGSTLGKLTT